MSDGLTIAKGGSSVCGYSATLSYTKVGDAPTSNTATAVLNNLSYTASDPIEWNPTVTRGSATVTDDQIGLNETLTDGATFTGSEQYTCSSTSSDYAGDGTTTFSESNTAIVTSSGAEEDRSTATETINCYAPGISKTAAGTYDERHEWDVEKTVNVASQSGFAGDNVPFTWGESNGAFAALGVPTTFLHTSFYWDNLIHFGMGPKRGEDGKLGFVLPMGDKKMPGIAAEDIGRCAYGVFERGSETVGKSVGVAGEHLTGAQMAAELSKALGQEVVHGAVTPEVYRGFGFPGADDLANMFQFKRDFEAEFCGARDVAASRALNPALQTFAQWLAANRERIPLG